MQLTVSAIMELQFTGKTKMYFEFKFILPAKQSRERSSSERNGIKAKEINLGSLHEVPPRV